MTIINAVPTYTDAPVALELLKKDPAGFAAKVAAEAGEAVVMVPAGETELISALEAAGVKVAPADARFGFLYHNHSAALKVLAGEKAIPSGVNGPDAEVVPVRAFFPGDTCLVWNAAAGATAEVSVSTTGRKLADELGVSDDVKAIYVGYPQNVFIAADKLDEPFELDSADYVRVYTSKDCMADALAQIAAKFHVECCGRCVYGHEGGHQVATILADIVSKKGKPGDLGLLRDLCPVMAEQALCENGRSLATIVLQGLALFGDEIEAHVSKKQCPAGGCKAFMTFHILVSKCTGCGKCLEACEDDAIMGKAKFVHVIDQKACVQCGKCLEACPEGAVVMAGATKPKTPPKPIPCKRK